MLKTGFISKDSSLTEKPAFADKGIKVLLAKAASGAFIVNVVGTAIALCLNILLARLLGTSQYGVYIYALTLINILVLVCQLGMNTSLIRFIPSYRVKAEWDLLRGVLYKSAKYVIITSIIIGIMASYIVWLTSDNIGNDLADTIWIALLILPLLSLTSLRSSSLRALKQVIRAGIPDSIFRPLAIGVLSISFYLYADHTLSATNVMAFNVAATLLALIISTIWLKNALPNQVNYARPVSDTGTWLKVSLPLFFIAAMNMLLHQTDIIMVGALMNTDQAGIYAVVSRISALTYFGLTAVNSIVAPLISELYSAKKHHNLQSIVNFSAKIIFIVTITISLVLFFFGNHILSLFGMEFTTGYHSLIILIVGQIINALAGSVGFLMTMTGHHNDAAKILGVSAIINIFLNAVLIPTWGLVGAAVATAISTVLWNGAMLLFVYKKLNINPTIFSRKIYEQA